ncbi:MAG: glycosyltransferase family 2 protein [Thermodesulfobacteriota bacterium]
MAAEKLSVAIITLNEEERLGDCLASVAFADEVVVVDAGSTDRTVAIAEAHGARVIRQEWLGFGRQKQFAIDQCRNRWVLVLDADERIPAATAREITTVLERPAYAACSLPRQNFFCGRWLKRAGWWPDRVVRLFDRTRARMSDRLVHEGLVVDGPVGALQGMIVHHANRDLAHTLAKINSYSSAGAEELAKAGRRGSLVQAAGRASWAFVHNYFLRRGFLDGREGFLQAACDAVNIFFKYAKLWELGRQRDRRDA